MIQSARLMPNTEACSNIEAELEKEGNGFEREEVSFRSLQNANASREMHCKMHC